MHRIAVIPARYASTRLPGKPLRDLGGRPLIVRVLEAVRACPLLDRAIVATDDERIARAVREAGAGEVCMTSPDHRSGTDRVAEVLGREEADWVVNVQGDEPFLETRALEVLLKAAATEGGRDEVGTLVEPVTTAEEWGDPSVVKAVADRAGRALYFSRAPIPGRMPGADTRRPWDGAWKHVGVYSCSRDLLLRWAGMPASPLEKREGLEQLRLLEAGVPIRLVENPGRSLGVDTEADLEEARLRWAERSSSERLSERKSD